ncbi:PHD finger protein 3 [Mixophyes fleayi]|uniref:PHD finger protein 3 n=1 Tax=Mixophyes fleayi TaxID=3061075 RepID=UPI003F4DD974
MDIVDTFNHLIPTEHLDDALFLGANLESEGCDEFSASQHVIEDSLKNMLSDKDPMLGSASTQFCLPVLDNTEPNFQIPPSTGVGLDDIMDVGVDKVTGVDVSDEVDLMLPNKNVNKLDEPSLNTVRKSPRLKAHESSRTMIPSTIEKPLNPVNVLSPKKAMSSREEKATDKVKEEEHILPIETNDRRGKGIIPLDQINISPVNSRRSSRIANKELKEKIIADENASVNKTEECSSTANDILPNTDCVLKKREDQSEILNETALIYENTNKAVEEIAKHDLKNSQGDQTTDQVLETPVEENVSNNQIYQPTDNKRDVIYDKVHQELALLSGVVECNLGVKSVVHSEINEECVLENAVDSSIQEEVDTGKRFIASEVLNPDNKYTSDTDVSVLESSVQNHPEGDEKVQVTEKEISVMNNVCRKPSRNQKGAKQLKSTSAKLLVATKDTSRNIVASKDGSLSSKTQKVKNKTNTIPNRKSEGQPETLKIVKVKKKRSESTNVDKVSLKTKMKKKQFPVGKKGNSSTLLKQLDDALRDNQRNVKETLQVTSSYVPSKNLSHSSDKSVTKHALSRVGNQAKDGGEQKEVNEPSEEKTKLKKSLPPRQRRSSKSISVDEPPLFIPDNIPAVKKEGAEVTSPSDKYIWNPTRHCNSCRKLHGNRFMVGCGRCDDWFHGECVGLSLAQAQQMEVDDKEYICAKCCAEEEKMDSTETIVSADNQNIDIQQDIKTMEIDKPVMTGCPSLPHEKSKPVDDTIKHKVKISKKNSVDSRHVPETKDSDVKKHRSNRKSLQSATVIHQVSEERHEKSSKDSTTTASTHDERTTKSGVNEKFEIKRKKPEKKGSSSSVPTSSPSTPKPSVDQIRQSVRQSLKDILVKRLSESTSKIPAERATKVSTKIEKELFSFYRDTDSKYKNKYRSLMFNLKDPKNNVLYKRVLRGDITPEHLIKMTPEELASRELAAWRQRENRHTIEMIEKEQREVERRPITKITHKGEIEIESDAPMKEPEAMDTEESVVVVKPLEKEEELQKDKDTPVETTSDTTTQHKNHLFDLNCKICTGRMAPPAEDLSPKKVKVSMGVMHKQSDNEADNTTEVLSSGSLNIDILDAEKPESPKETFFPAASSDSFNITDTAEDESTFLARLNYIWKGFLNMPSVAKFIIKAYPVSGSLEHLTEDLPDSIQVGGRISPQTVWDYVEKIKASGTKETCVIRFSPETEEDQISYTLLYSYFSSRKRYGVVANNMRLVKDMYLIPLGASEKIPHFFVPFDGPGLEARRPNLLLALIIRQKVKRQHSTNPDDEHLGLLLSVPEKRNRIELGDDDDEEDDENDFFNSFTAVLHKNRNRPQLSDTEEPQAVVEPIPEAIKRDPPTPLRFLPGVLVGWENPQSTLDLANKPLPDDDILQSLLGTTENAFEHKPPNIITNIDKPLKELKVQVADQPLVSEKSLDKDIEMDTAPNIIKETKGIQAPVTVPLGTQSVLSLKGKPPDVSTEVFLTTINVCSSEEIVDTDLLEESGDVKHDTAKTTNANLSPVHVAKSNIDDNTSVSLDAIVSPVKSPKLIHIKRDPRQAAGRSNINSSDAQDFDLNKNEGNSQPNKESTESTSRHKKDKTKKHSHEENELIISKQFSSSTQKEAEMTEASKSENAKQFPPDLLIDETDPLQQFRRALAANKSQASDAPHAENSGKILAPAFAGNFSALRLQPPPFLPLKSNPPTFPFQHTASFPLQGNPIFPYTPHIPPLLPTPLGIGFPRPPRFHSAEANMLNPLVAWHPTLQLARQPPNFFGHVTTGPLLSTEQVRYQPSQKLYHKDHRGQERRHSDPWDKQDRISDRSLSRESRSEQRQRFYSESHHSRDKRHEKESVNDKHLDRDSERSRRRDRDKERSHDRDRKSRDESHREKERSRASDSRSSKEGRSGDKSKSEDRAHEKEKSRERNRDREEEKERDRHHKDRSRDHSEKSKSKR